MIISRLRARTPRTLLAVVVTTAVLAAAGTAQAAPTLVAPATGATVTTVRPTTSWTVPGGETIAGIEFSSANSTDVNGSFAHTTDFTDYTQVLLTAGLTSHTNTVPEQLHAGTWFWHALTSNDATPSLLTWSPTINSFTIPPVVGFDPKSTAHASKKGVDGKLYVSSNTVKIGIHVRVVIGRKQCMNKAFGDTLARTDINTSMVYSYKCHPARKVAKGTKITVIVTVTGDSASITRTRVTRV